MKVQTVAAVVAAIFTRLTLAVPMANSEEVVGLRQTDSEESPSYVMISGFDLQRRETRGLTYNKLA